VINESKRVLIDETEINYMIKKLSGDSEYIQDKFLNDWMYYYRK